MEESKDKVTETQDAQAKKSKGLKSLNNRWLLIGGGAAIIIVGVIVLFLTGVVGAKVAASVNGTKIYVRELDKQYKAYEASYTGQNKGKKPDKKQQTEIKKLILERLIQQELSTQIAKDEGIKVTDKELNERLNQIKKSMSKKQLNDTLKKMNWTMDDLENMVKMQLLQTKVRDKFSKGIKVTDEDVKKQYDDNTKNYLVPETATAKVATFTAKDKKKADSLKADIDGGKKFDDVVKNYIKGGVTAAPLTKDQAKNMHGKKLADAIFKLKNGQTTGVIKTNSGYAVALVEKQEKAHQKTFDEVKEDIRNMLKQQKQMESYNKKMQEKRKAAKIKIYIKELKTKNGLPSNHP